MNMSGFLKDANGQWSSIRLIFLTGSLWNMIITSIIVLHNNDVQSSIAFFSAVEGILLGLKLGQKPMENKK